MFCPGCKHCTVDFLRLNSTEAMLNSLRWTEICVVDTVELVRGYLTAQAVLFHSSHSNAIIDTPKSINVIVQKYV